MKINKVLAIVLFCFATKAPAATHTSTIPQNPKPPGPYARKAPETLLLKTTFKASQPVVGTYYFYWYDDTTKAHFIDHDGTDALTRHPETPVGYSYKNASWHLGELNDVAAAGIDFILPVYWGYPGDYAGWSFQGLPPLVEAARTFEKAGRSAPKIGCFYDTSTLKSNRYNYHADLTTDKGLRWLYITVRDFFSLVPPELRATVEKRPIVWLYSANFAKAKSPKALAHLSDAFKADFGVAPFIVKEVSWPGASDAVYAWGAALRPNLHSIAAVGPGYDHSAVPGRSPLVKERENGDFYRRSWEWILARPLALRPSIAVVETWNEWHEGTDIAPSKESGDFYVRLTRRYSDLWHAQKVLKPTGPYSDRKSVSIVLGADNITNGITQHEAADGKTKVIARKGTTGRGTVQTEHGGRFIYFDIADGFYWAENHELTIHITYLDTNRGTIALQYDSTDKQALLNGAFKSAEPIRKTGSGTWKTATLTLSDAACTGRANGYDFRIADHDGSLLVHKVVVTEK